MRFKKIVILILLGVFCGAGIARASDLGFELNANDTDLEGAVIARTTQHGVGKLIGVNVLYSRDNDDYILPSAYIAVENEIAIPGLSLGLGFKGVAGSVDFGSEDFNAVAIGFQGRAEYDIRTVAPDVPVKVALEATFAPSPLCLSDTSKYSDVRLTVFGQVHENASVLVGFRNLHIEFDEEGGRTPKLSDDALFIGIRLWF